MDTKLLAVKDEPFEELYVPEPSYQLTVEKNETGACCLCPEGNKLQQFLFQHIQEFHLYDSSICSDSKNSLNCCSCYEGLRLQTDLINHLLSHFSVKDEIDNIKIDIAQQPVAEEHLIDEVKSEAVKKVRAVRDPETQRFFCKICFKSFLYKQGLQKHFKKEHDPSVTSVKYQRHDDQVESKIKCDYCVKTFKHKQGLQKHWGLEHNPVNPFACPNCFSRCKTLKNLHAHMRTHEPPRNERLETNQCHKCFKIFPSLKQLSLHYYTHREKFFCCDICGSKFNNREQIKNHVMRHVGLYQKRASHQRIICDQCSTMVYSHKMKRHKMIHHSDEKPFKCDFEGCNATFSDSRILNDHMNIHLKLKPYKCEHCSEAFRSGANLRLHRIRHTDPDRFKCNECQTSFVTKQALQKHNRRHTEDPEIRPFACDYPGCNSTFKQKDHVRNHIRRTHEKTDEIFCCEFCSKSYNRRDALGKHLRKAHNICKRRSRVFPTTDESAIERLN